MSELYYVVFTGDGWAVNKDDDKQSRVAGPFKNTARDLSDEDPGKQMAIAECERLNREVEDVLDT